MRKTTAVGGIDCAESLFSSLTVVVSWPVERIGRDPRGATIYLPT